MKYVFTFAASEFVNFRQVEFYSLLELCGIQPDADTVSNPDGDCWSRPYLVVNLADDEQAKLLIKRSVLIKSAYELWCDAPSITELMEKVSELPDTLASKYLGCSNTYKVVISSANRKMKQEDKLKIIEDVLNSHRTLDAKVSLQNPDYQLNILMDYAPQNWKERSIKGDILRHVYYGRLVGSSDRRVMLNSYRLADRAYLGNTSMHVGLSGIMANCGLCQGGSLVWDPFVGTGSILLAASVWGAFGAGSDIDYALLHGMGMSPKAGQGKRIPGECLRSSYRQYGLESRYLDVIIADAATLHRLLRTPGCTEQVSCSSTSVTVCNGGLFDAILTDPPYGFRESSRRIAGKELEREASLVSQDRLCEITGLPLPLLYSDEELKDELLPVPHDLPHFPHKEAYPLSESYHDLLELAVRLLRPGGRIVFWIPAVRSIFDGLQSLPRHPRLRLLGACEQVLNGRNSRFMLVMTKLFEGEPDEIKMSEDVYFPAIKLLPPTC